MSLTPILVDVLLGLAGASVLVAAAASRKQKVRVRAKRTKR